MKNSSFVFRSTKRKRVSLVTPKQKQRREKKQVKGWKENSREFDTKRLFSYSTKFVSREEISILPYTAFSLFLPSFSIEQILAYILDYFLSRPSLFSFLFPNFFEKIESNRIESNRGVFACSKRIAMNGMTEPFSFSSSLSPPPPSLFFFLVVGEKKRTIVRCPLSGHGISNESFTSGTRCSSVAVNHWAKYCYVPVDWTHYTEGREGGGGGLLLVRVAIDRRGIIKYACDGSRVTFVCTACRRYQLLRPLI